MNHITVGTENSQSINIHYEDLGSGKPVILIHGWPLTHQSWEMQVPALLANGNRVITYCRRGFGQSSKPSSGYDYNTLADDLSDIINHLNLTNVTLVGFSMGTGEVARYLAKYGATRINKAVFISGILPALLKTENNPDGVDEKVFRNMIEKCTEDRPAFMQEFIDNFYAHGVLNRADVSDGIKQFSWNMAMQASPIATVSCISSWLEDFRGDIQTITIPTLVIHGSGDKITPIKATGERLRALLPNCEYIELNGAPHGLTVSHPQEVNAALISFINSKSALRESFYEARH